MIHISKKHKLLAAAVAVLMVVLLLAPNFVLVPAQILMRFGANDAAFSYLERIEKYGSKHDDYPFIKAELYYRQNMILDGLALAFELLNELDQGNLALTKHRSKVIEMYTLETMKLGMWSYSMRGWDLLRQHGWDGEPWHDYQEALVASALFGHDLGKEGIPNFSHELPQLELARRFIKARDIGAALNWDYTTPTESVQIGHQGLLQMYSAVLDGSHWLEAEGGSFAPPYQVLAHELKDIYQALEIVLLKELGDENWFYRLEGAPLNAIRIFAASIHGAELPLEQLQQLRASLGEAPYTWDLFYLWSWYNLSTSPEFPLWPMEEVARLPRLESCYWSQDGEWLAIRGYQPEGQGEVDLYSPASGQHFTIAITNNKFLWSPRGHRALFYDQGKHWLLSSPGEEPVEIIPPAPEHQWRISGWLDEDHIIMYHMENENERFAQPSVFQLATGKIVSYTWDSFLSGVDLEGAWYRSPQAEHRLAVVPVSINLPRSHRPVYNMPLEPFATRYWLGDETGFKELFLPHGVMVYGWVDQEHLLLRASYGRDLVFNVEDGTCFTTHAYFMYPSGAGYIAFMDYEAQETVIYRSLVNR